MNGKTEKELSQLDRSIVKYHMIQLLKSPLLATIVAFMIAGLSFLLGFTVRDYAVTRGENEALKSIQGEVMSFAKNVSVAEEGAKRAQNSANEAAEKAQKLYSKAKEIVGDLDIVAVKKISKNYQEKVIQAILKAPGFKSSFQDAMLESLPSVSTAGQTKIRVGKTAPGKTMWRQYQKNGISVTVDTTDAGFTTTPIYLISLSGVNEHWTALGTSSIYDPTANSFQVYINWPFGGITPESANNNKWSVNWIGIGI